MRLGLLATGVVAIHLAACAGRPLPPDIDFDAGFDADAGASPDAGPLPGAVDWGIAVGIASPSGGSTVVTALAPLADGGVIVTGGFTGTVSFASDVTKTASAPRGAFVARYRPDQRLVWVTVLSAPSGDVDIADLATVDGGEVAIAGWFGGTLTVGDSSNGQTPTVLSSAGGLDLFVARIAADGSVRWSKQAGGAGDDIARGIASRIDASGAVSIALTGATGSGARFGIGEPGETQVPADGGPILVADLDGSDGALRWAAFPGGQVPAQGYGVAIDGGGLVGVTGYVNGRAPFGAGPTGAPVMVDPAVGRGFVAAWTSQGRLVWALPLGGAQGEGNAIVDLPAGGFVAAGLFLGTATFGTAGSGATATLTSDVANQAGCFLAAVDEGGALNWVRRLAGSGLRPWRLRRDGAGALSLAAWFGGMVSLDPDGPRPTHLTSAGNDDAAFIQLDADGALGWVTTGGGLGDDEAADVAPAPDGTFWAAGHYSGPATFGTGPGAVTLDSGTGGGGFLLHLER